MNRVDFAPEQSLEELLASIRNIISDSGDKGPAPGEVMYRQAAASGRAPQAGGPEAGLGEEVFDLTDEFVSPDEPSLASAPPAAERLAPLQPSAAAGSQAGIAPGFGLPADPSSMPEPALRAAAQKRSEGSTPPKPDVRRQGTGQAASPVWSRREVPSAAAAAQKPRTDAMALRSQGKNWTGDIQMPIPAAGPVSLIPNGEERPAQRDWQGEAGGLDGKEEAAAVAALAGRLARSAMGAMEASELQTAQQVDFEHLDEQSRAEVTERFADAIERESAVSGWTDDAGSAGAMESAQRAAMTTQALPAPAAVPPKSVAQAQFAGSAQYPPPAPIQLQGGRTLEDAVREMLRPLLVQWLNEHMPRILENAIREEIAVRGVFPKSES
jgi:cell pole-organizing protein PopZ